MNWLNKYEDGGPEPTINMQKWIDKTASFEGFESSYYKDDAGKLTIGYGFNLEAPGTRKKLREKGLDVDGMIKGTTFITKEQALPILTELYTDSYNTAKKKFSNFKQLPEDAQHVLTDMVYNLGERKIDQFKKMKAAVEKNDYKQVAAEIQNSKYAAQTGNRARTHIATFNTLGIAKDTFDKSVKLTGKDLRQQALNQGQQSYIPASTAVTPVPVIIPEIVSAPSYGLGAHVVHGGPRWIDKYESGDMIKRADGSYSPRGLWDNIRANRGSGNEPTEEMLKQERIIRAAEKNEYGGMVNMYGAGGYTVRKTDDRAGKTHEVTGPDGTKKYFGDPSMGERGNSKLGEEAFRARHARNLRNNPYFRAYANATWEYGGKVTDEYKKVRSTVPRVSYTEPSGIYTGPTTQRGITFEDGGPTDPLPKVKRKNFVTERSTTATRLSPASINNYTQPVINPIHDTSMGTLVQLLDPTGMSNYPDLYRSLQTGENVGVNIIGSLPLIGKAGEALKLLKGARTSMPLPEIGIKYAATYNDVKPYVETKKENGGYINKTKNNWLDNL